jgi:hypothetical protein
MERKRKKKEGKEEREKLCECVRSTREGGRYIKTGKRNKHIHKKQRREREKREMKDVRKKVEKERRRVRDG